MIAIKFLWGGVTLIMCSELVSFIPAVKVVGMVLMVIGAVLLLLDK